MFGRKKMKTRIADLEWQVELLRRELREAHGKALRAFEASLFTISNIGQETFAVGPVLKELLHHLKVTPYTIQATRSHIRIESNDA